MEKAREAEPHQQGDGPGVGGGGDSLERREKNVSDLGQMVRLGVWLGLAQWLEQRPMD